MDAPEARCFCARLSTLPEVLDYLRQACHRTGVEPAAILRIELVVEELFTNTVRHGYRGDSDAPVWLHAAGASGSMLVTYQDAAPPHDPLAHTIHLAESPDDRVVGGLGNRLARGLTSAIAYRRAGDRNVLTLTFRTGPG
jgi:anti-sigma regulatory factor (Ser/Thr protein kinase)